VSEDRAHEKDDRARGQRHQLTRGSLLAKNALLTIGSQGLIVAVQIAAIPLLISQLGTARFGVLSLAWVVIGYAGVFDLGLGRALTKFTAERLGEGTDHEIPRLFWTATILLGLLGVVAATVVAALSPWLVRGVLEIPEHLEHESLLTFLMLAGSIPFVLVSAALRGSLEARQRFDVTNAVAVPLSLLSYFGPVVLSFVSTNLAIVMTALVFSRMLACAVLLTLCLRVDPALAGDRGFSRPLAGILLRFGGWVTATAILAPLLGSLDRFVVGALVSARGVAYYATPFEAVRQLRVVSMAIAGVLFPAFAATIGSDRARAEMLFRRGTRGVLLALFPLAFCCVVFAPEILDVWVGDEFARNSTAVMQWLAGGILVNGVAFVAYGMLQSVRPDLLFKLYLAELPFYVLAFWLLISAFGVEGAAIAWTVRATVDAALLFALLLHLRLIDLSSALAVARPAAMSLGVFALAVQLDDVAVKSVFFAAVVIAFGILGWFRVLERQERSMLRSRVRLLLRPRPTG
jgi:O-antigen/teichoic acid export membrane protein